MFYREKLHKPRNTRKLFLLIPKIIRKKRNSRKLYSTHLIDCLVALFRNLFLFRDARETIHLSAALPTSWLPVADLLPTSFPTWRAIA